MCSRHPERGAGHPQVITGYVNVDGSGNGNWVACAACSLPAKPGDIYCAGHLRLFEYTDRERSGAIAANE